MGVEVWGQQYPPTQPPPPYPSTQPPHQQSYAPAGYATPSTGYGGSGGHGNLLSDPMILMLLMRNGGLSSNPLAMIAMMGGGKKMNPFLMSKLLQCKEEHAECTQPNNPRHEVCGLPEDEYHYSQS